MKISCGNSLENETAAGKFGISATALPCASDNCNGLPTISHPDATGNESDLAVFEADRPNSCPSITAGSSGEVKKFDVGAALSKVLSLPELPVQQSFCTIDRRFPAVSICVQCPNFLCQECADTHTSKKAYAGHCVRDMSGIDEVDLLKLRACCQLKCLSHPTTSVGRFCTQCGVAVCPMCTLHGPHRGHPLQDFKDIANPTSDVFGKVKSANEQKVADRKAQFADEMEMKAKFSANQAVITQQIRDFEFLLIEEIRKKANDAVKALTNISDDNAALLDPLLHEFYADMKQSRENKLCDVLATASDFDSDGNAMLCLRANSALLGTKRSEDFLPPATILYAECCPSIIDFYKALKAFKFVVISETPPPAKQRSAAPTAESLVVSVVDTAGASVASEACSRRENVVESKPTSVIRPVVKPVMAEVPVIKQAEHRVAALKDAQQISASATANYAFAGNSKAKDKLSEIIASVACSSSQCASTVIVAAAGVDTSNPDRLQRVQAKLASMREKRRPKAVQIISALPGSAERNSAATGTKRKRGRRANLSQAKGNKRSR